MLAGIKKKIDTKVRKLLTCLQICQEREDIENLDMSREKMNKEEESK